ncbi:MAG: hypothetical protein KKF46_06715 [Nanoarchaeota archaeon]|nr:hypothetical protein [Nanoarchaeota archaeon]MBU1322022.1 hypothetical protein [Nanoarchaeota archaeon]MBU1598107.1 hypothetical protein [Nanoarchaeota archaeon]MBU2441764.1 hypothetical protein [Nanoarchaeota archaeon]
MTFINADDFKEYLNPKNMKPGSPDTVFVEVSVPDEYTSSILVRSQQDYDERVTIDFTVKFKHHEHQEEGKIFQREISIEHHQEDKSQHDKPHVQFHIHGANPDQKVGHLWLMLDLDDADQYEKCIEGFFPVLKDIVHICREDLDEALLNKEEIDKLGSQRQLLLEKIQKSLQTRGIEYEFPGGHKEQIFFKDIDKITSQDRTLIPLLNPIDY